MNIFTGLENFAGELKNASDSALKLVGVGGETFLGFKRAFTEIERQDEFIDNSNRQVTTQSMPIKNQVKNFVDENGVLVLALSVLGVALIFGRGR